MRAVVQIPCHLKNHENWCSSMKKTSLCFLIPSACFRSGIVRVVVNLANALNDTGRYDMTLLALEPDGDGNLPLAEGIRLDVLEYEKNPAAGTLSKIDKYRKITASVRTYFKTRRFSLCVVFSKEYATFVWLVCRKMGMPLVMWEATNFTVGKPLKSEWTGKQIAMRFFSAVVCQTKKDHEAYLAHRASAEIRQIYNMTAFRESPAPYRVQSKKIISAGYLAPVKGFDFLLKAARQVFSCHPDWQWDIYGEGDERENLEKTIEAYGLSGKVNLKGYCAELGKQYCEYAMFVLTSRYEGMGMVLVEAQKNHLPLIAFDVLCGPSDVITNDVNGYLIPPFDTGALAQRICELIENPEKRMAFSRHACDHHSSFDPAFILSQWEQLISDFTGRK